MAFLFGHVVPIPPNVNRNTDTGNTFSVTNAALSGPLFYRIRET